MDRFRSGRSLSPLRQAEAYWSALRTGGAVPRRTQIDPRGLENILEYTFILERVAPQVARFRLAGQHLNGLAGMDVRGMPMTAFFTEAAHSEAGAVLEHMFDAPAVAELTLAGAGNPGRPQMDARMILLPLQTERGAVSRALGVLVADAVAYTVPCRFTIRDMLLRPVTGFGASNSVPQDFAKKKPATTAGFAEEQSELAGQPPYLRVVK